MLRSATQRRLARKALRRFHTPRERADLLGDLVTRLLDLGCQTALVKDAYAAQLAVADRHLAVRRYADAAEWFEAATRIAFHRTLHFDHVTSPLTDDPAGFTALHDRGCSRGLKPPVSSRDLAM